MRVLQYAASRLGHVSRNTEFNILLFGFMTHFIWEMLQMPLFRYAPELSLVDINQACIQASAGDALMMLIMFWSVAAWVKSRRWIFHLTPSRVVGFLLPGVLMTVVFEALATGPLHRWTYGDLMPIVPVFGTGLAPLAQWLMLPPLVLWFVRRQLGHARLPD